MTPEKLSKMSTDVSNKCWKCETQVGSYHMWWSCGIAKKYWKRVHAMLQQIMLCNVPLTPELFLLSMIPDNIDKSKQHIVMYIVTAARILYAKNWNSPTIPKQEDLIGKIREIAEMDILSEVMKDYPLQKATERWDLFNKWTELTGNVSIAYIEMRT